MKKAYKAPLIELLSTQLDEYCETSSSIVIDITPETGDSTTGGVSNGGYGGNQGSISDNFDD